MCQGRGFPGGRPFRTSARKVLGRQGSGGPLILEAGRVSATFLVASHFLLGPSGMALSDPGVLQEPGHQSPSRVRAAEGGTHEAKSVKPERFFFFLVLRAACGAYRNFQGRG